MSLNYVLIHPEQVLAKWLAAKVASGHGGTSEEVEALGATLILTEKRLHKTLLVPWKWQRKPSEVFFQFIQESDFDPSQGVEFWQQVQQIPEAYKKLNKPRPMREINRLVERLQKEGVPQSDEVHQVSDDDDRVPRLIKEFRMLKEVMGDRLKLNTLTKRIELEEQPLNVDRIKLDLAADSNIYLKSSREDVHDFVCKIAEENAYSPVVKYLEACHQQHGNDTSILDGFSERYFGQSAPIYEAFVKRTLIAAVARAYNPGCQHDTALVLQGKQGFYKSSFFRTLSNGWFDDSLGAIGDKDERLKLHQVWFVEWGELESVFRRKDIAATKAFLTCRIDMLRPPYARNIQEMPRASVIVGSTNQEEFLSDPTGNRRFWIIPVVKPINLGLLQQERDRIWAAAIALYRAGESWDLSATEHLDAAAIAQEFQTQDPWEPIISSYLDGREMVTTREILEDALKIEPGRQDKASQMRVADILRDRKWKKDFGFYNSKRQKIWHPISSDPPTNLEVDQTSNTYPEGHSENGSNRGGSEVDHPSNGHQASVLEKSDPPDPPPRQHLPKNNGRIKTPNLPNSYQIGGSGGSGGSVVDRRGLVADPPPDPPLEKVDLTSQNREDLWKT